MSAYNTVIQSIAKASVMTGAGGDKEYLYVLGLADDCYYVGRTRNLRLRLWHHFRGSQLDGSAWTALHAAKTVLHCGEVRGNRYHLDFVENQCTLKIAHLKGFERVRGGAYSSAMQPFPATWLGAAAIVPPADMSRFRPIDKPTLLEMLKAQHQEELRVRRAAREKQGYATQFLQVPHGESEQVRQLGAR